ncbi:MAG: hypothetical protein ACI3YB_01875 [Prevotella sp.]
MKKFLLGFLPMLLAMLGALPAQALTLQWDNPGAIVVQTKMNDASTNVTIDPGVTQIELPEANQYYIRPAEGYKLVTCETVSGGTSKFNISNYGQGQFVSVSKWYNGYTLKFTTEKMVSAGSITVNVINGADKIAGQLTNKTASLSNNTPVVFKAGEQTIDITNYDNNLYIGKANGVTLQSIYSVKLNNEPQTSSSAYYPQYNLPIKDGDKIEIQVYDPDNMPVERTVTFKFKNGDDKALTGVYNVTAMASKFYDQLVKDKWTEKYESNSRLRLNFNEDYIFNSITANGTPLEFAEDDVNVTHVITEDTEFIIDATKRTYDEVTADVYVTDPEAVSFLNAYDGEALTLTEGTPASGVKMGKYEVPDGTKLYTLSGIDPKTGKIFLNIKAGYYVKLAACANPEDKTGTDPNNITYLNAWDAQNGPFFLDIRKIENTAKAVVAFDGDQENARIQAYNTQGETVAVEGLPANIAKGYTEFNFDPTYYDHFAVRIAGDTNKGLFVYLDGTARTADDNGVFQDIKIKDGSVLKIFLAAAAHENNRVSFTVAEGLETTVMYDKIKQHTDLSKPLVSRGATLVEITPKQPAIVKVAGKEITADASGVYSFTTASLSTTVELSAQPVKPLEMKSVKPAEDAEVKTFSSATVSFTLPNEGENGVDADVEKINTIKLTTPADETIAATMCEMGEPDFYNGAPFTISFPEQTAAGKYTLTIPAGIFHETVWDETAYEGEGGYVAKAGGSVNDEIVVHFTVNPDAAGPFDKYVTTPKSGSLDMVRRISTIKVTFPNVSNMMPSEEAENVEVSISKDATTYKGNVSPDWSSYPAVNSFNVTFVDNDDNEVVITDPGQWILKVGAGLYKDADGETSGEITAKFNVNPMAPISWTADPENGSKQDMPSEDYTMITFNLDAAAVSYTAKDELAGIRVKYRGTEVDRLEDITTEGANGYMLYDNYGEPQVIFAFNKSVFNAPGELTIECDEGAFTVDDEASPMIDYSVTFGDVKEYTYKFTPASGSEVESIKEFTLEFPEATTARFDEDNQYIILRSLNWIYPSTPTITAVEGAEHPTFKLVFDLIGESLTPSAGSYSLRIGEGSFVLDDNQLSPEMTASWTLKRTTEVDLTWKADPVQDFVNEGYGVYPAFIFNENESLSRNSGSDAKIIVKFNDTEIESGNGSESEMKYNTSIEYTMPNAFMFKITGGALNNPETEGKLTIIIEEGALLVSGVPCPRMEHTWNVVKQKEYEVIVTPKDNSTVTELKDFTIEFVGAKTAEFNFETGIAVRSTDYRYTGVVDKVEFDNSGENAKVNISLKEPLTNNGKYMLQVYQSTFFLDGCQSSPEIKAYFTVDHTLGIGGITADENGKYTVVTLSGVVVLRNGDADQLHNLPDGLYIVNGKKVALHK